jgi:uncharacterized protein YcbK (DUF882 family)
MSEGVPIPIAGGNVQKSPSSKATAILTGGAYIEYVSTAKWRERRWRLFSTFPYKKKRTCKFLGDCQCQKDVFIDLRFQLWYKRTNLPVFSLLTTSQKIHSSEGFIMSQQALWSRRLFLKSSLVGMALLGGRLAFPDLVAAHSLPEGRLRLYNVNTKERLLVTYRNRSGRYDQGALDDMNYFLRCPHSNQICEMDIQLLECVNQIEKLVGRGKEIRIFSAYRSPSYNDLLIRLGRGAAPNSLHTTGQALDIAISGVRLSQVRRTAAKLKRGGVGYYRRQGFIHLDTGPLRYW